MAAAQPGMNLKQLEYFVSVAELGSFSKAALVLNIAQPALSRQVRLLETDLHVNLLTRTGRGVVLTEAGKRLFDHSVGILQLVARATEDIDATRDEPSGRIVIGLPPSIGRRLTLPLVEAFRRNLPKARLAIVEGLSTHLTEWIATGRVDLGLIHNPEPNPAIEVTPVLDEVLGLVGPAGSKPGKPGKASPLPLAELRRANNEVERQVQDRTLALTEANCKLEAELREMKAQVERLSKVVPPQRAAE